LIRKKKQNWKLTDSISNRTRIPILNIYYLLCYAWDKLEEGKKIETSSSEYDELINLFARVLVNGCNQLFKRGLDKTYQEVTEEYQGIKGRIEFKQTLNKNLFRLGKVICTFDNFDANNLQNQILKATLLRLTKVKGLERELRQQVWNTYIRFEGVGDIEIQLYHFNQIKIHRNNSFYDLLLRICRLIIENTVLTEKNDKYRFRDFIGSEKQFASLFETFIRNFYKKEQHQYTVGRENINWDMQPLDGSSLTYLPKMETDVTLESPNRKIIIETKYYANAFNSRYGGEKFNSTNLYQLYSYLKNVEAKKEHLFNPSCEGILLYPSVNYSFDEKYQMKDHMVRIKTVNLNKPWQNIKNELLELVL
jgi:5-methylcytosine-specific restriction enzyme subunit McrC